MTKPHNRITFSEAAAALHYDPVTGVFRWRFRADAPATTNGKWAGKVAGSVGRPGYRSIHLNGNTTFAQRLAWLLMTGEYPDGDVDHINGERDDNRWCNLRCAKRFQNLGNSRLSPTNRSGVKGVSWCKHAGKWVAQISIDNKTTYLGRYTSLEDAKNAYVKAARQRFGDFARFE